MVVVFLMVSAVTVGKNQLSVHPLSLEGKYRPVPTGEADGTPQVRPGSNKYLEIMYTCSTQIGQLSEKMQ